MTQATNRSATIRMWPSKTIVDPFDLQPEDVHLVDIAHSLARQCRYTGSVEGFISVAEHSIVVATLLQQAKHPKAVVKAGLMHDASEAYLGDISGPLKRLPAFDAYREAEFRVETVISAKYQIKFPFDPAVKVADTASLNLEMIGDPANEISPIRHRTMADTPSIEDTEARFLAFARKLGVTDAPVRRRRLVKK